MEAAERGDQAKEIPLRIASNERCSLSYEKDPSVFGLAAAPRDRNAHPMTGRRRLPRQTTIDAPNTITNDGSVPSM